MGFFDGLEKPAPRVRECYLRVKANHLHLSAADIEQLFKLVDNQAWSASQLTTAFKSRGFDVSRGVIDRHRAKACPCFGGGNV